jgi:hypothetical protein
VLDYQDLDKELPGLAHLLAKEPTIVVPLLNVVTYHVLDYLSLDYSNTFTRSFVKVKGLPAKPAEPEPEEERWNSPST